MFLKPGDRAGACVVPVVVARTIVVPTGAVVDVSALHHASLPIPPESASVTGSRARSLAGVPPPPPPFEVVLPLPPSLVAAFLPLLCAYAQLLPLRGVCVLPPVVSVPPPLFFAAPQAHAVSALPQDEAVPVVPPLPYAFVQPQLQFEPFPQLQVEPSPQPQP